MSPEERAPSPPQPPPAAPQPGGERGAAEDAADAGDAGGTEEPELPAQPGEDVKEEEGPGGEPRGVAEEGEESGGRRKIVLTPLEKLKLSTLNLTSEAEPEPPPKPARLRLQAAPAALPGLWRGDDAWEEEEEEEEAVMEEGRWLQAGVSGQAGLWVPLVPCHAPCLAREARMAVFLGQLWRRVTARKRRRRRRRKAQTLASWQSR